MAQNEVFEYLIRLRYSGDDDYKSPVEIHQALNICSPENTRKAINRLYAYGYLEIKKEGFWRRFYRVKEKYVKDVELIKSLLKIEGDTVLNGKCKSKHGSEN